MFVIVWNDYLWQLVMVNTESMKTLQLGVAGLQNEQVPNMSFIMASLSVAAVPMIAVFLIFQKYFTRGITLGAIKE